MLSLSKNLIVMASPIVQANYDDNLFLNPTAKLFLPALDYLRILCKVKY